MTPPRSITATVLNWPWVRNPWQRRITLGLLALIFALLSLFPKPYRVTTELLPNDSAGSLSASLGGFGSNSSLFSVLFGGGQSIDVDLTIGRSEIVILDLARKLRQQGVIQTNDINSAAGGLRKKLRIEVGRGSLLDVDCRATDREFCKKVLTNYTITLRQRLSQLNRDKTAERKAIAEQRMGAATERLSLAQANLIRFKTVNRLGAPESELGAASALITGLEGQLQAERTNLDTLSRFTTGQNVGIQSSQARISSLESQIAQARVRALSSAGGPALGALTPQLTQYENLYREERFAEAQYQVYERYLDTVSIDELAADINLDVIEPPYVGLGREYNTPYLGLLAVVILLAAFAEFYLVTAPKRIIS